MRTLAAAVTAAAIAAGTPTSAAPVRGPFALLTLPSLGSVTWRCGSGRYALGFRLPRRSATTRLVLRAGGRVAATRTIQPGEGTRLPWSRRRVQRLELVQQTGAGTLRARVTVDFVPGTALTYCYAYGPPRVEALVGPRR